MNERTGRLRRTRMWTTDDQEPDTAVRVLIDDRRTARAPLYLARFHHGWLWVRDRNHLSCSRATPLAWRWAISEDNGSAAVVRELTPRERRWWRGDGDLAHSSC